MMAEILAQVQILQNLDDKYHWFCNSINDEDPGERREQVSSQLSEPPRQTIQGCFRLFAYDTDEIRSQKEFLVNGIDEQLSRCDVCIIEYYKAKKEFLDQLREEYNDDDVEILANMFHHYDVERIRRGLTECTSTLQALPNEKRTRSAISNSALHALLEALTCEKFLVDKTLVQEHLVQPLALAQTNALLCVAHYVPAMSEFLISDDGALRSWAIRNLERLGGATSQEEFDFAFRGGLARQLAKASVYPLDPDFVLYLWQGLKIIVDRLDNDLVTHSLRALELSVYRIALDHLQIPSSGMRYIVQTLRALLQISPTDFWDAMGAIGPTTVAEQIFRSPQFSHILHTVDATEGIGESSPLADILSWPQPLIASLQVGQRPPLCRTIVSQLMQKVQMDGAPTATKDACFIVGLNCIYYTLNSCVEGLNTFDTTSHAVIVDALSLTSTFLEHIVSAIGAPASNSRTEDKQTCCKNVLGTALILECKALRMARHILQSRPPRFSIHPPNLWRAVASRLRRGRMLLSSTAIEAMGAIMEVFYLDTADTRDTAKEFNTVLGELFGLMTGLLDKTSVSSRSDLGFLTCKPNTIRTLAMILPYPEHSMNESALELIKAMTDESFRNDALRRFLSFSLRGALEGLSKSAQTITSYRSFGPCPVLLKIYADVVEALCDPQTGVLRQTTYTAKEDLDAIKQFWNCAWEVLSMMYESCESWSMKKVAGSDALREFVRDVMQFSERLFDCFAVFDSATTASGEHSSDKQLDHGLTKDLLVAPSSAMDGVTLFLRLKDEYLLRTSVQLVRKLLTALTKEGMVLSQSSSDYLAQVAIYNDDKNPQLRIGTKTLLSPTEIAGITLDLEANLGRSVVKDARAMAIVERNTSDLSPLTDPRISKSGLASHSSLDLYQKTKKQGTIDLGSWSTQAAQPKTREKHPTKDHDSVKGSNRLKDAASVKSRAASGLLDRKAVLKGAQSQRSAAQQEAFLNERKKQKQETEARKAEQAAKIKRNIPTSIAGQTSGEGSALARIGVPGKDHAPKGDSMMVSSDSESESDDEIDKELFGTAPKNRKTVLDADSVVARSKQLRAQMPIKKTKVIRSVKDMRARLAPQMSGLWSRLLAWDFFHEGDFPPNSTKDDYSLITDSFRTPLDYRKAFEALLLLEAWSSLRKSREEGNFRNFEMKISNRITVDSLFEVSVVMEIGECKSMGIFEADIIILSKSPKPAEDRNSPHCLGRIHRIKHKKGNSEITVRVAHTPQIQSVLSPNANTYAARIDSIVTLEREYGALAGLEWYDLCQEIIEAQVSPMLKYTDEKLDKVANVYKLNRAQARAVQSAVDNDAFTLIQGPPGSGKTKTIVAIVGALLTTFLRDGAVITFNGPGESSRGQHNPSLAPKKLLVCAPSNAAVDELVMRFMAGVKTSNGKFHKPNVVRLGRSDKVNPQVLEVTLDELVDRIINPSGAKTAKESTELEKAINAHKAVDKEIKEMYTLFDEAASAGANTSPEMTLKFEKLKRDKQSWSNQIERLRDSGNTALRDADIKKRQVEQRVLNDAHIICATLSGSARESFQHLTIDFETVVIDEAAQCIELSALIPLKYGCSKCIMVGDPKQLPPTVLSREAARFQYEQSLFVRMQRNQPGDIHLLDTQYRMHPAISQFPSAAFYDGKLLDGPNMDTLRTQSWHEDKLLGPYRFFDVAGKHESAVRGHSLINKFEIEVALELYRRLRASIQGYDFTGKIGVITPYKSQLRLLSERFQAIFGPRILKSIEFNTTDAFQGRESEIIIFSCVRASDQGIGFLSDIRRMNVGITRAKSSLWVLGSSQALVKGEYWRALIQDAQSRGLYSAGNIINLLKEEPKISKSVDRKVQTQFANEVDPRSTSPSGLPSSRHVAHENLNGQGSIRMLERDDYSKPIISEEPGVVSSENKIPGEAQALQSIQSLVDGKLHAVQGRNHSANMAFRNNGSDLAATSRPSQIASFEKYTDYTQRAGTPTELKRKRSKSPPEPRVAPAKPPPPIRKVKKDDAAFIKPRRKK